MPKALRSEDAMHGRARSFRVGRSLFHEAVRCNGPPAWHGACFNNRAKEST